MNGSAWVVLDETMSDLSAIEVARERRVQKQCPSAACPGHPMLRAITISLHFKAFRAPYTLSELCDAVQNPLCSG